MFYETHHIYESYFWLQWFVYTVCVYRNRNKSNWFSHWTCFFLFFFGELFCCWHKNMFTISSQNNNQCIIFLLFCKNRMTIFSRGNNPLFWALFCLNWVTFFGLLVKNHELPFLQRESLMNQKKASYESDFFRVNVGFNELRPYFDNNYEHVIILILQCLNSQNKVFDFLFFYFIIDTWMM